MKNINSGYIKSIISVLALMLILLVQLGPLDQLAKDYTEQGLKRVLVTYALARGLNGVISVAQGTEIAVQPVGVGVTFTPGQILDPVNDLVEQFSSVVLVSGASLGIQRMLIQMTSWHWFSLLCSLMLVVSLIMLWSNKTDAPFKMSMAYKIAAGLLIVRFVIPLIAVINENIYTVFLQPQYNESSLLLDKTTGDVVQLNRAVSVANTDEATLSDKLKNVYSSASAMLDIQSQLTSLKKTVDEVSQYVLNMIVVFVLQTLIFPIVFLFLAYKLMLKLLKI